MNHQKRIIIDPKIMTGKPVIAGTRITVEHVLKLLAQGITADELVSDKYYPHLKKSDIYAVIDYANTRIKTERIYPLVTDNKKSVYAVPA